MFTGWTLKQLRASAVAYNVLNCVNQFYLKGITQYVHRIIGNVIIRLIEGSVTVWR